MLQALLDAEARGDTWRDHGLSQAPHFLHEDGTVKVQLLEWRKIMQISAWFMLQLDGLRDV